MLNFNVNLVVKLNVGFKKNVKYKLCMPVLIIGIFSKFDLFNFYFRLYFSQKYQCLRVFLKFFPEKSKIF